MERWEEKVVVSAVAFRVRKIFVNYWFLCSVLVLLREAVNA